MQSSPFKVAILDMYEGSPNLGMTCILEVLNVWATKHILTLEIKIYNVRLQSQIPDLTYDVYISTGGPGSPVDSKNSEWDNAYTQWLETIINKKKWVFLICHSFQMACRHFEIGKISLRKSRQIGILPVHPIIEDSLFNNLGDPFYALESRYYQITEPNDKVIVEMGAQILALEKIRPDVPLERAIMAVKFNDYIYGVQFHPEGESNILLSYFKDPETKASIIEEFGIEKWDKIMMKLADTAKTTNTFSHFIPNFLDKALIG